MKKYLWSAGLVLCLILAGCQEKQERITEVNEDALELIQERIDVRILPQAPVSTTDEKTGEIRPADENHSRTEDLTHLQQTAQELVDHWQDAEASLSFTVQEMNEEGNEYEGEFATKDDWELSGETEEGQEFVLKSVDEGVLLEFDGEEELLSREEFTFLFPMEHVKIAEEVLQNENFESLTWKKQDQAAVIEIRTTAEMLQDSFQEYLAEHLEFQQLGVSLQGYGLEYRLFVDTSSEAWVLQELEFILQKDGSFLEHLHFMFQ